MMTSRLTWVVIDTLATVVVATSLYSLKDVFSFFREEGVPFSALFTLWGLEGVGLAIIGIVLPVAWLWYRASKAPKSEKNWLAASILAGLALTATFIYLGF